MTIRRLPGLVYMIALVALVIGLAPAAILAQSDAIHGIDSADMDLAADPRVDFYRFANGGWMDRTTIPSDRGRYNTFNELNDETIQILLDILDRQATGGQLQGGTDPWKVVRLYEQGIDVGTRDRQGVTPIALIVAELDAITDLAGIHGFLEGAEFRGIYGLFPIFGGPDLQDSSINSATVYGPFLGLPNRDFYVDDDPSMEPIRTSYVETAAALLGYLGYDAARATAAARAVYELERSLAEQTLTREEQQDFSLAYNPRTIEELATTYPLMNWERYTEALGIEDVTQLVVSDIQYLKSLDGIVRQTPVDTLRDYMKLELLWTFSSNLSLEIEETAFNFDGRVLNGLEEMSPIEERALDQVNLTLGEALGQLYVAENFPPEAKAQILELIDALRFAFRVRLEANTWMSPEAKAEAFKKLDTLQVKVGYPGQWQSYAAVTIDDSYALSVLSANNAMLLRSLDSVGKPVDKTEWFTPPQTVNAYYNPLFNEIIFPAAILQPPFFDFRADPASNFGAIGFVIGHEITHAFDLQGSQFDAEGNLRQWWTPQDVEQFQALNDRVVAQYNAIEVLPGVNVNGQITVTENVADLGGVQVAYHALEAYLAERGAPLPPPPALDGATTAPAAPTFTQQQRFFIAAASVWRAKTREETLLNLIRTDSHAPSTIRSTRPLRNMDVFFPAFSIASGDPMFLPPENRIVIW
ncbi:MAG: M13 family metallopeptidase [Chloroflexota bacterium]|nr:M13 family metallopeptidase [Chloroflexota bacterium]